MKAFVSLAIVVGTALTGWGFYAPIVNLPGIGTVRFTENFLGGTGLAAAILALLLLALLAVFFRGGVQRAGLFCAGGGAGLALASLLAIHRGSMDKLQQLNDMTGQPSADVAAILARMKLGFGFWLIAAGLALWALGVAVALAKRNSQQV